MTKKKQQPAKKVAKTYRPKFADRWFRRKRKETEEEGGILTDPRLANTKAQVSTKDLPIQYKDPSNVAYTFPPSVVVVVLLIILFIIGYFLF